VYFLINFACEARVRCDGSSALTISASQPSFPFAFVYNAKSGRNLGLCGHGTAVRSDSSLSFLHNSLQLDEALVQGREQSTFLSSGFPAPPS